MIINPKNKIIKPHNRIILLFAILITLSVFKISVKIILIRECTNLIKVIVILKRRKYIFNRDYF